MRPALGKVSQCSPSLFTIWWIRASSSLPVCRTKFYAPYSPHIFECWFSRWSSFHITVQKCISYYYIRNLYISCMFISINWIYPNSGYLPWLEALEVFNSCDQRSRETGGEVSAWAELFSKINHPALEHILWKNLPPSEVHFFCPLIHGSITTTVLLNDLKKEKE